MITSPVIKFIPDFIRAKLEGRRSLQKIIGNAGWLLFDKLLRMGVGLFVSVWVARYLGPARFGALNYAVAFVALFSALASLGLDGITVREIVKEPERRNEILGSVFLLKVVGGTVTFVLSLLAIVLLRSGDLQGITLVAIVAAGTIFQAFDTIDFWFQSQVLSKYAVYAKNIAFLIVAAIKVVLIVVGANVTAFALAALGEIVIGSVGLMIAYRINGHNIGEWRLSRSRCRELLHDSWPLVLGTISVMLYMKIDQVMLGDMLGNAEVGVYTAATKISELWYFIPTVIVSSTFPAIIQAKTQDEGLYYRRLQRLFNMMSGLAFTIALPMTFLSSFVVRLLYGTGYSGSAPVLAIHIWAAIFVFLGIAQGPWDLTENLTRLSLLRTLTGAIINIGLNMVLIPSYGALGAASATIISQGCSTCLLNLVSHRTRPIFYCQVRSLWFFHNLAQARNFMRGKS